MSGHDHSSDTREQVVRTALAAGRKVRIVDGAIYINISAIPGVEYPADAVVIAEAKAIDDFNAAEAQRIADEQAALGPVMSNRELTDLVLALAAVVEGLGGVIPDLPIVGGLLGAKTTAKKTSKT